MKYKTNFSNKILFCILLFTFCKAAYLFADVPHTTIVEVMYDGKKYFLNIMFEDPALDVRYKVGSKAHRQYIKTVDQKIKNYQWPEEKVSLYSSMENIYLKPLTVLTDYTYIPSNCDSSLHIFKGERKVGIQQFLRKFKVIDYYCGNTGGYVYSEDLKETDNIWIMQYPLELLFTLEGHDICDYSFFAIKGNLSKSEKSQLKRKIQKLLIPGISQDKLLLFLKDLYQKNIIMIGMCSC